MIPHSPPGTYDVRPWRRHDRIYVEQWAVIRWTGGDCAYVRVGPLYDTEYDARRRAILLAGHDARRAA